MRRKSLDARRVARPAATKSASGVRYYGLRYYSPSLGRFVNKDPIEEQGGINLYAFCANNGVNHWDYLGNALDKIHSTHSAWVTVIEYHAHPDDAKGGDSSNNDNWGRTDGGGEYGGGEVTSRDAQGNVMSVTVNGRTYTQDDYLAVAATVAGFAGQGAYSGADFISARDLVNTASPVSVWAGQGPIMITPNSGAGRIDANVVDNHFIVKSGEKPWTLQSIYDQLDASHTQKGQVLSDQLHQINIASFNTITTVETYADGHTETTSYPYLNPGVGAGYSFLAGAHEVGLNTILLYSGLTLNGAIETAFHEVTHFVTGGSEAYARAQAAVFMNTTGFGTNDPSFLRRDGTPNLEAINASISSVYSALSSVLKGKPGGYRLVQPAPGG